MVRLLYFISYLLRSFHLHGIHSPFVFQLTNEVLREKARYYAYDEIESVRAKLLLTEKKIEVKDLGTKASSSSQRSIRSIAKKSSQIPKYSQIIHRLCRERKALNILELGTSFGITTAYLAKACPEAKIISIDAADEVSKIADINLKKLNIHNVRLISQSFKKGMPLAFDEFDRLDVVYFDGNHNYQSTLDYFEKCISQIHQNSLFIIDDIHWSSGMSKAWKKIQSHPKVTTTVNLFKIGLVYFDDSHPKQNIAVYHSAVWQLL